MNEQWDVGRALALSGLFRVLKGAGRACAAPFLTLYLWYLGLPASLVGVVAAAQYLAAALWAPLCSRSPGDRRKRQLLVTSSLLASVGVSLLLTLIPPANQDAVVRYCNASQQPGDQGAATVVPSPVTRSYSVLTVSPVTNLRAVAKETTKPTANVLIASPKPMVARAAFQESFGLTPGMLERKRIAGGDSNGYLDGPSDWMTSVEAFNWETREPEMLVSYSPPLHGLEKESSLNSAAVGFAENAEEGLYATQSDELFLPTTLPTVGDAHVPGILSDQEKDSQDNGFRTLQNIFWNRDNQVFLMALGAVVVWQLLATSLEWTVDENLYEYLDFVDATDRYGRLWIWSSLGASVGASGIAVLVDQLNCNLGGVTTRLAVHFYASAILTILSSLLAVAFPIHVPRKSSRANKTAKALGLLWSDHRAVLSAVTLCLAGAAASTGHNYLFWQLQGRGSSELYMGLSVAVGLLGEVFLSFFKRKFLRTFSRSKIVAVGVSLLAVQLLCYSFLWTPWSVLLIQILAACSSSALWWVVSMTVDDLATPGMERSLHAVLWDLCHGGGMSLGSLAGGFVVEHFGLAVLYRVCCLCLVLWLFLFLIIQSKLPQQRKINYSSLLAADLSDVSYSDEENERDWLVKAVKDESFHRNQSQQHGTN